MSNSNCCFLNCIQISQEAGQVVWYSHLFQNFPVYCDQHSQRLWHSQQSRCFSGTLLLFRWSNRCWQFDLWFLLLDLRPNYGGSKEDNGNLKNSTFRKLRSWHLVPSVQFSCSVMSNSLRSHGLQHAKPPLSITNSKSLLKLMSIESMMPSNCLILCRPLLLHLQSFPASGSFQMSQLQRTQSI